MHAFKPSSVSSEKRKLALITGGSSGMGLEFARQLAASGHDLLLVSIQEKELEEAGLMLSGEYGVSVSTRYQDLAKSDSALQLFSYCKESGLMPDILVCNAGMFFFKELHPEDLPRVEAMLNLHIATNTALTVLFGEEMKMRGYGKIILMSSMAAKLPAPGISVYSASKAYLKSFGKSMWFELHPYGVDITTVCPAAIATPLYRLKPSLMKLGVNIGVIKTPRWLVKRALRASRHARKVISPSFMNIWLPPMIRLLPGWAETMIWKKIR